MLNSVLFVRFFSFDAILYFLPNLIINLVIRRVDIYPHRPAVLWSHLDHIIGTPLYNLFILFTFVTQGVSHIWKNDCQNQNWLLWL